MRIPFAKITTGSIRLATMLGASLIMVWAPVAQASISQSEVQDFAKWPLYQPCGDGFAVATGGVLVTGTSPFLNGDPLSLTFPTITDDTAFAAAIEAFIRKASPDSPWLKIPNFGTRFVLEGRRVNVNPMLIVVIGRQESQLGTSSVATKYNNSFGNKGSNGDYRTWPSFEASLFGDDSFTDGVPLRLAGHPSYKNVTNMYEYLSVHVSGQIIYPGDTTTSFDSKMGVTITATSNGGPKDYFTHAEQWIGEMTGLDISGVPARKTTSTQTAAAESADTCQKNAGAGADSGLVNAAGYSWPVAPQEKRNFGTIPCSQRTCHHDGTPAADLYYGPATTMDHHNVFAISDGKIINAAPGYGGVAACYSIQFLSTKDSMYYWYGHITNPQVTKNQLVKAGQKLAEVAPNSFGSACRGGRDHLHIDRGCTKGGVPQPAGYDDCRDWSFIPFMNNLLDNLPAAQG